MGLLTAILTAPLAPVHFVEWTAQQVLDSAEQEIHDPAVIRQQLSELAARADSGEISEEEFDRAEDELLARLPGSGQPHERE